MVDEMSNDRTQHSGQHCVIAKLTDYNLRPGTNDVYIRHDIRGCCCVRSKLESFVIWIRDSTKVIW